MVIAQQVIHQEKLKHNILLYGYIDDNNQFLNIFDLIKINRLWEDKKIYFQNLPACADLTLRNPFSCFRDIIRNMKKISTIIKENNIDNIFIGDVDNIGYQFIMYYLKLKFNVKINIFEEGISHYIYKKRRPYRRRFQNIQEWLLDKFYFKPYFGFKFAKYWYREGDYENLPIDSRWSIIPNYYKESYDRRLFIDYNLISNKTLSYMNDEIKLVNCCPNVVFLITSIIYNNINKQVYKERYDAYLKTIDKYINCLPLNITIIAKLHPREKKNVMSDIRNIVEKSGHKIHFISKELNIPIELYLQRLRPSAITVFCNSSSFYNGFLYPKCKIIDLIHSFFEICDRNNYNINDLKEVYKTII